MTSRRSLHLVHRTHRATRLRSSNNKKVRLVVGTSQSKNGNHMKHYSKDETEGLEDSDDFDEFDRRGYINPKHILVMYKRGWIPDKESAVAQYICCSIKMREYNALSERRRETYHESVEKIAAKFG